MSSQTFTSARDASEGGGSFRQFMTSYAQSHGDTDAGSNTADSAMQQPGEATANAASPSADVEKQEPEDGESSPTETPAKSVAATMAGDSAQGTVTGSRPSSPLAGLSPMQLLFSGAALTQIVGAAYPAAAAWGATGAAGQSHRSAPVSNGAAVSEKPKSARESARDAVAARDASHVDTHGAGSVLAVNGVEGSPGGGSNSGESRKPGADIVEAAGGVAGALHAEGAANNTEPGKAATNFAFAVRLTSDAPSAPAGQAESGAAAADTPGAGAAQQLVLATGAAAAVAEASTEPAVKTGEYVEEAPNDAAMMWTGEHTPAAATEKSDVSSDAQAPAATVAETDPAAAPGEPVRNIRLQLDGESNQRVDIRLVDVGGEMRVSVRAGDTRLAQTLQDHIPDLANRLDTQHVRAEIWTPRAESASASNSSNTSGQPSRGGEPSGQGGGHGGERRQQNGQQQKQPDWVDEFENYSNPAQTLRSNQIWRQ